MLTDEEKQEMIDELKAAFALAEEENVSENGYSFKNKQGQMITTYEWLLGQEELDTSNPNNAKIRTTRKKRLDYEV